MTSSNGIILRVTGHLCGEFTGHGENNNNEDHWIMCSLRADGLSWQGE